MAPWSDLNSSLAVPWENQTDTRRKYTVFFASLSIASVMLLLIRQFNALRFLFGIWFKKGKKQGTSEQAATEE